MILQYKGRIEVESYGYNCEFGRNDGKEKNITK